MSPAILLSVTTFFYAPPAEHVIAAAASPAKAPSVTPEWLTPDQMVECATALADGLRAGMLARPTAESTFVRIPVVQNDTPLPVPDSDVWVRALGRAVALRTGARIRFVDADTPAPFQARAMDSRLVLLPAAENGRDVVIALQLVTDATTAQTVAQYLVRDVLREERLSSDDVELAGDKPAEMDYELSVPLENGELRFHDDDIAEDVHITVETLETSEDGVLRIRVRMTAPDDSVRLDITAAFLRGDEVVRTSTARSVSLQKGRPKTFDLDSDSPADRFVLYFDE